MSRRTSPWSPLRLRTRSDWRIKFDFMCYTGWPLTLFPTSHWRQNKKVPFQCEAHFTFTKMQPMFWCQLEVGNDMNGHLVLNLEITKKYHQIWFCNLRSSGLPHLQNWRRRHSGGSGAALGRPGWQHSAESAGKLQGVFVRLNRIKIDLKNHPPETSFLVQC